MTRTAGDRSDPDGVAELFFAELGYSDADAIETAAALVKFLDKWGLELAPSMYIKELEGKAGSLPERSALPRNVWTVTEADSPQFNAIPVVDEQ